MYFLASFLKTLDPYLVRQKVCTVILHRGGVVSLVLGGDSTEEQACWHFSSITRTRHHQTFKQHQKQDASNSLSKPPHHFPSPTARSHPNSYIHVRCGNPARGFCAPLSIYMSRLRYRHGIVMLDECHQCSGLCVPDWFGWNWDSMSGRCIGGWCWGSAGCGIRRGWWVHDLEDWGQK